MLRSSVDPGVGRYWPVPYERLAMDTPERIVRHITAWPHPGAYDRQVAPNVRPTHAALISTAAAQRLLGPLLAAVDAGALGLPEDLVEEAVRGHEDAMLWCLRLEERLLEIADWFREAGGVEFLVVKGPAVAHLDDIDPSLRFFADIDLLVAGNDFDRAMAALTSHGAQRRVPQRRAGFDRRFDKSVGLTCADHVEIDVHRTLCVGAPGFRIPLADLFAHPDAFDVGGITFAAPALVHRALHAAYHAIVGTPAPQLRTLRDLAHYLTRPDLPLETVVAEAERWRGTTILAGAVRATLTILPVDAPNWQAWLAAFEPDPDELAIIMDLQHESARLLDRPALRELAWRDRASFLWAVAFPDVEFLRARGLTRTSRITQGVRNLIPEVRAGRG